MDGHDENHPHLERLACIRRRRRRRRIHACHMN
jgi:hypothetical protein